MYLGGLGGRKTLVIPFYVLHNLPPPLQPYNVILVCIFSYEIFTIKPLKIKPDNFTGDSKIKTYCNLISAKSVQPLNYYVKLLILSVEVLYSLIYHYIDKKKLND